MYTVFVDIEGTITDPKTLQIGSSYEAEFDTFDEAVLYVGHLRQLIEEENEKEAEWKNLKPRFKIFSNYSGDFV